MPAQTSMLHVRIDDETKAPNAKTRAAMAEADKIARTRRARFATADALFADLEKNRRK